MTREDFIELLKSYKENKAKLTIKLKELRNARIQLKNNDEYDTSITSSFGINQDIHSKNQISDKVGRKIEENDTKMLQLEEKINKLEDEVKELRDKVDIVEDRLEALKYKEKQILVAYYVEGRTAEDIGNKLYFQLFSQTRSDRHIQRIIDKATKKMLCL
jgi:DNA-directed RNA polymerase specialized sigma subunit